MSKKGQDLKAFLNKNKKKGAKADAQADEASVPETAVKGNAGDKKAEEAKQINEKTAQGSKSKDVKKDESSDEEVDDDLDQDVQYGHIKEAKDVVEDKNDNKADGFGYDQSVITRNTGPIKKAEVKEEKPSTGGFIKFTGGRPTFSKKTKKAGLLGEFSEGL